MSSCSCGQVVRYSNSLGWVSDVFCLKFVLSRLDSSKIFWRRPRRNIGDSEIQTWRCILWDPVCKFLLHFLFFILKTNLMCLFQLVTVVVQVKMSLHLSLCFRGLLYFMQPTGISHRCHGKMNMSFPFEDFDGAPDLSQAVREKSWHNAMLIVV